MNKLILIGFMLISTPILNAESIDERSAAFAKELKLIDDTIAWCNNAGITHDMEVRKAKLIQRMLCMN